MSLLGISSFKNHQKNDYSLMFFFLITLYMLTFFPLISTGFTTNDDMGIALQSFTFSQISSSAKLQGRIGFFWAGPLSLIPYIYQNEFYYQLVRLGAPILLLSCLFILLRNIYRNSIPSLLAIVLFFAFIQNSWEHNLMTSYPFIFNAIFCFLIISIIFFIKYIETGNFYYGLSSAFFYFLSLSFELFTLYFFIFIFLSIFYNKRICQSNKKMTLENFFCFFNKLLPIISVILLYLIIYLLFRYFNPSHYDGNTIQLTDWNKMLIVVWQYSISSFPGYYFLYDIFSGQISLTTSLINFLYEIRVEWIVKAIIVFYAIFHILLRNREKLDNRKLIIGLLIAILCIFVPNILLGLTGKYQHWVAGNSKAYTYTYYSFIGTVCSLSLISVLITNYLRRFCKIRTLVVVLISTCAAIVCLATDFHNFYTTQDQVLSQSKWRTIDRFLLTPEFQSIKNGSFIYAPSLISETRGIAATDPSYWSAYFRKKTGKLLNVIKNIPRNKPSNNESLYFVKYKQESNVDSQYLVFSLIDDIDAWHQTGALRASSITVFSYSKNKLFTIFGFFSEKQSSQPEVIVNDRSVKSHKSAFMQEIDFSKALSDFSPVKIQSKSTLLDPNHIFITYYTVLPTVDFDLILLSGFHGWEYNQGSRASWTNGNAQIGIYNSSQKSEKVILRFSLGTLKAGLVTLHTPDGSSASYNLQPSKGEYIEIKTILNPGHNTLLFETNIPAESPSNSDIRKISFGVSDIQIERFQ